jgi:FAD/FMN-containing dehydrogenase
MNKTYTKREFLKMMGLGIAFLPFMSCFDHKEKETVQELPEDKKPDNGKQPETEITDADVLLLSRNDTAYESFNTAFNKRIKHLPKYIAVCRTDKGVQYAVKKAKEEQLKIAVKSGGHSFEGFSSNDGGMVINLSQMKKISWLEHNEVDVQPGCLLQDIQAAFFPKGKLLPSGSCGTVGIGGLTLGGGYGFFSRKYGLTCDSLIHLTMVGADGNIYHTDKDPELLWACKGGGNGNFGVVTSFRFRALEMPARFSSYVMKFRSLTAERFGTLLDTWFDVSTELPPEAFAAFVLNGKTLTVLITTYGLTSGFEQSFAALSAMADSYTPTLNQDLPKAMKRYYGRKGPIYFKNASCGLYKGREEVVKAKDALFDKVISNPGIVFQINTLGGNIDNPEWEKASCYPHRAMPYLGELQAYWDNERQEAALVKAFEDIQSLLRAAGVRDHYRNYPDINFPDWETAYYGKNYGRLQEVKRKYDPQDIFHYPQSVRV